MAPLLATDYGNLPTLLHTFPVLLVAAVLAFVGAAVRAKGILGCAAILFFPCGVMILLSLPEARGGDDEITLLLGWGAVALSVACALAAWAVHRRKR